MVFLHDIVQRAYSHANTVHETERQNDRLNTIVDTVLTVLDCVEQFFLMADARIDRAQMDMFSVTDGSDCA